MNAVPQASETEVELGEEEPQEVFDKTTPLLPVMVIPPPPKKHTTKKQRAVAPKEWSNEILSHPEVASRRISLSSDGTTFDCKDCEKEGLKMKRPFEYGNLICHTQNNTHMANKSAFENTQLRLLAGIDK